KPPEREARYREAQVVAGVEGQRYDHQDGRDEIEKNQPGPNREQPVPDPCGQGAFARCHRSAAPRPFGNPVTVWRSASSSAVLTVSTRPSAEARPQLPVPVVNNAM